MPQNIFFIGIMRTVGSSTHFITFVTHRAMATTHERHNSNQNLTFQVVLKNLIVVRCIDKCQMFMHVKVQ